MSMHFKHLVLSVSALLWLGGGAVCAADEALSKEYQVKAAFLYNFVKFVEWPAHSFSDANSPIVIGSYCSETFGEELQRVVRGRQVNGREVVVRNLESADSARSAQMLFVCADYDAQFVAMEQAIETVPVLTIGESATFREQAGMIVFVPEGGKVRFEINVAAAERSALKISSQLQKLASAVRRAP